MPAPDTLGSSVSAQRPSLASRLSRSSIPGLDAARAVAVSLVVLYHFGLDAVPGATGVTIFFVLSGFLITWLLLREYEGTGTISFKDFYLRRGLRIFPAFYFYWAVGTIIYVVRDHPMDWGLTWSSLAYVTNYYLALVPNHGDHFLGHTWSLAIEEQFYLLWPIGLWMFRRDLRRMTQALIVAIVCIWIYRAGLCLAGVSDSYLYHAFDTRADQLLIGCLTAVCAKRGLLEGFAMRLARRPIYLVATAVLLYISVAMPVPQLMYRYTVGYPIQECFIVVLLLQLIMLSGAGIWSWTEWSPVRYLGRISYSVYLWQQLTLFTSARVTSQFPLVVQLAFALVVTVAFAAISFHFIERPFLRLKDRLRHTTPVVKSPAVAIAG
ncbi:MAG TPA: acyltransferase [Vicinamibacterales bacterium]|jgi:peptidoglycan/LPS O-acetylase OafA/YrhL